MRPTKLRTDNDIIFSRWHWEIVQSLRIITVVSLIRYSTKRVFLELYRSVNFFRQGVLAYFSLFISNIKYPLTCINHILTLDSVLGDREVESRGNIWSVLNVPEPELCVPSLRVCRVPSLPQRKGYCYPQTNRGKLSINSDRKFNNGTKRNETDKKTTRQTDTHMHTRLEKSWDTRERGLSP